MDYNTPGFSVLHHLPELAQIMSTELVMPSNHLILCCPLLFLLSVFPSIKVFSTESALFVRWPKHWSFNFSISPFSEYSGLISFRIDWFALLAVQGTLNSPSQFNSMLKLSMFYCLTLYSTVNAFSEGLSWAFLFYVFHPEDCLATRHSY